MTCVGQRVGLAVVLLTVGLMAQPPSSGAAAVAEAILSGASMPVAEQTNDLPRDVQAALVDYRQREKAFHTALKEPPGATPLEEALFEKRVAIERVLVSLFPRKDIAKVAASFASDVEVGEPDGSSEPLRREAAFIDSLFHDLEQTWLAPYLNLVAGQRKLCASQIQGSDSAAMRAALAADARRQLTRARDGGQLLIRVAAEQLLATGRCSP